MLDVIQTEKGKKVTAGYPAIEALIDSEDFSLVNETFEAAYGELAEESKIKRGLRKSREAKKAMHAIELVMALLKELLEIKYKIAALAKKAPGRRA